MESCFRLKPADDEGIAELIFDCPGEKINTFSEAALGDLHQILGELRSQRGIRFLLIQSAKKNIFVAGADIRQLAVITDRADAMEKARAGQEIFNLLENLPFATMAVIDGACVGGGMEMALACRYRFVSDDPKVQMGLPEVNLGIVPGWGGTQRLPRRIGLIAALEMIVGGKMLDGSKAFRKGLADGISARAFLEENSRNFARQILAGESSPSKKRASMLVRLMEGTQPGRALIFRNTLGTVMKKTQGHFPAPLEAVALLKATFGKSLQEGLGLEAEAFSRLAPTAVCKNLIHLFFLNEQLKKDAGGNVSAEARELSSAGVLGAGVMGGGIAWLFSNYDMSVRMKDLAWDAVSKGYEAAAGIYKQLSRIKKLKPAESALRMDRISASVDYRGFKGLDVVIEAIVENMDLKKKVLAELEDHIGAETLIGSNTSALSITEMAGALKHPERFVGIHFFNPVNRMPLVEIIPGAKTSEQTVADAVSLARKLHKTPIVVGDCAGFLVNRILLPYMNEAAMLLEEGFDPVRLDHLVTDFGMPMGPFTLADEVGIDVGYKVAKILEGAYGERMKVAEILRVLYEDQHLLGKKGGAGFYLHGKDKSVNPVLAPILDKLRAGRSPARGGISEREALDRCLLIMVNEAARCLEEAVVASPGHLDMAMIMGTGFPPFRGGLLKYADSLGPAALVAGLEALENKLGGRFAPAEKLLALKRDGKDFYTS
ncbi:MAG: enoyl-CoA hydratase/isomerase family protein [Planctomycetes bacterium]|nr:enoyl-CoA hydratase/isomerase family protein [Planctomycetota bacterium]